MRAESQVGSLLGGPEEVTAAEAGADRRHTWLTQGVHFTSERWMGRASHKGSDLGLNTSLQTTGTLGGTPHPTVPSVLPSGPTYQPLVWSLNKKLIKTFSAFFNCLLFALTGYSSRMTLLLVHREKRSQQTVKCKLDHFSLLTNLLMTSHCSKVSFGLRIKTKIWT